VRWMTDVAGHVIGCQLNLKRIEFKVRWMMWRATFAGPYHGVAGSAGDAGQGCEAAEVVGQVLGVGMHP